jgi:E3 ubiquitin-protein ligase HUWE1
MIMSGLPEVDIDDLRSNTEYSNYTPSSPQIQWFWRAVRSFNREQRLKLIQFATGTGRIPSGGFAQLVGMRYYVMSWVPNLC